MSEESNEDELAWNEVWHSNASALEGDTEANEPDPESMQSSNQVSERSEDEDTELLRQKLRSAEGRLEKFEEHIADMRSRLDESESLERMPEPEVEEAEPDTFLPEGWTQDDWEDYQADYPAQAELIEKQGRQVENLERRLDSTENSISVAEQNRVFDEKIRKAHPDYDDLLANERDNIVQFIESQSNPTLKSAYEAIYRGGNADQIIDLVADYKATGRKAGDRRASVNQSSVDNALAVPGKTYAPSELNSRSGMPAEDSFDAGWDYFSKRGID